MEIEMTAQTAKRGFFRNALNALMDARFREAQRVVDAFEAKNGRTRADVLARRSISAGY
ncbi:hypothetical protein GCM10016234_13390 [Tianweitania populi]|uniref:Uncharacterized protein n=2 Tax=Phyllobacteriaceae TaxID=69277 RepID=A0A8J3DN66_9HYPH|nr:hypothetical protein GCM10016234_13390 [Tianweitania populi]